MSTQEDEPLWLALAEALHLPQVVDWIERQIERWPWLYRMLSR